MSYSTFISVAYWAVFAVIVLLVWTIVGFVVAVLFMRGRRRRLTRYAYLQRVETRDGRAFEDTCWYLLRDSDARLARQLGGTREFVSDINEHRQPARTLVSDLQEAL